MAALAHRVRRMQWQARTPSERQAFALRSVLRTELEDVLLPGLARVFDRIAPGDAVVRIPRLEIALRVGGIDEIHRALAEAIERQWGTLAPRPSRPADIVWRAALMEYLAVGTMDWSLAPLESRDVARKLQAVLDIHLDDVVQAVCRDVVPWTRRQFAFFRLLRLLPPSRWADAARDAVEAAPASAASAPALRKAMEALAVQGGLRSAEPPARMAAILLAIAGVAREDHLEALRELASVSGAHLDWHDEMAEVAVLRSVLPPAVIEFVAPILSPVRARAAVPAQTESPRPPREVAAASASDRFLALKEARPDTTPSLLALRNAGLVLLHPFLPSLLSHCGLRDEARITDLPRAAALLHWLATGVEASHEFELDFAKILLGLRPEQPLAVEPGLLMPDDRAEGEAVLHAVVTHWKALGGTSIEGIRVSFLQRPGYVREDDEGWKLTLESEAFDVLVARLPWGIAMTRLPWMTQPLFTDWPTP